MYDSLLPVHPLLLLILPSSQQTMTGQAQTSQRRLAQYRAECKFQAMHDIRARKHAVLHAALLRGSSHTQN